MSVLHAAVIQLHTIEESTTEILGAIAVFENVVHFHGTDGHFLQSLGNKKPVIYLGKVIDHFLLPVRQCMKASNKRCTLNQAVACVVLKGMWRSPHLSLNDVLMLQDSFKVLAKLLA